MTRNLKKYLVKVMIKLSRTIGWVAHRIN